MCRAVKEVGSVVPEDGRSVVFCCSAEEEIEVSPARCCLSSDGRYSPFAYYERDVGEVSTDGGEVGFKSSFVGVRAPRSFAPGLEDVVVCGIISCEYMCSRVDLAYRVSSSDTECPKDS